MALTVNEQQLCEAVLLQQQVIAAWSEITKHRDINPIEAELARLQGPLDASMAKVADSLSAYQSK